MYFTDEFMDEWAEDMDRDREVHCEHRNRHDRADGQILYSGAVMLYEVCDDCGWRQPTDRYTSVM